MLARAPAITRRAQAGLVRDGHGDLRAEHVVLEDGIEVVDCVEFDSDLRRIDVGEDLAFLVMDLTFKGGPELARDLVRAYRASGGDPGDDALLAFHAAVRAWVRAKVACLRSDEPAVEEHRRTADAGEAQSLFAVGERLAWRARGPLVLAICGVPGSGKSYLAAALRESSGLEVVASDVVRKRLDGLVPTERAGPERYSDAASRATYRHMGERARDEIRRGGCLIVDATFRRRADRDCFRDGLAACPPPVVFVECRSPADVLAARARERDRRGGSVSDATAELVERLAGEFEPLDDVAPECHVVLRTDRAVADVARELVDTLDRRLEALPNAGDHPPVKR
jgi:predicted kinase